MSFQLIIEKETQLKFSPFLKVLFYIKHHHFIEISISEQSPWLSLLCAFLGYTTQGFIRLGLIFPVKGFVLQLPGIENTLLP